MTLYELDKSLRDFELEVDEDGVITNIDALEELEMARDAKVENVALFIKNLRAEADAIAAEVKILTQRKKVVENKAKSLTEYLKNSLAGEKFKTARVAITYRKSERVICDYPDELEHRFQKVKVEADKTAIKAALKAGEHVAGARIEEVQNMVLK